MPKMRICTKCGNVEDSSIFFCTKCGWKTEEKEIEATEAMQTSFSPFGENIDTLEKEETGLQPEENDDVSVPHKMIVSPIKSTDTGEHTEEYFVDINCPYCHEKLSFMNWQFDEFFLDCPMCNQTIFIEHPDLDGCEEFEFTYSVNEIVDGGDKDEEILDIEQEQDYIDVQCPFCNKVYSYMSWQLEEDSIICPECDKDIYTEFLVNTDGVMKVLIEPQEEPEDETEGDDERKFDQECFVDVTCPSCKAELSFMNWQVNDELTCPICDKKFRV